MKKLICIFLVLICSFSLSAGAFAAEIQTEPAPEVYNVETSLLFGESNSAELAGGVLIPGERYDFPVFIQTMGETRRLIEQDLVSAQLRLEFPDGRATLKTAKTEVRGGLVFFVLEVEEGYPTHVTELSLKLELTERASGNATSEIQAEFATGYAYADAESIALLTEGEAVDIHPDRPVYTAKQLERISEKNFYKNVTFKTADWEFTANAADMDNVNFAYDLTVFEELFDRFPRYDFKVLNFKAPTKFPGGGSLKIDVSDIEEAFGREFYVYRYENGTLTRIRYDFVYDPGESSLTIDTNALGTYVITDKFIFSGYRIY